MEILLDGVSQQIKDGEAITIHETKTVCLSLLPSLTFYYSVIVEAEDQSFFTVNVEEEAETLFIESNSMVQVSFLKQKNCLQNDEEVSSNDAFSECSSIIFSDEDTSDELENDECYECYYDDENFEEAEEEMEEEKEDHANSNTDDDKDEEEIYEEEEREEAETLSDYDFELDCFSFDMEEEQEEEEIPSIEFLPQQQDELWWKQGINQQKIEDVDCESDGISLEQASVQSTSFEPSAHMEPTFQNTMSTLEMPPNPTSMKKLKGITGSFSTMMRFFQKSFEEIEFEIAELFCSCI